LNQNRYYPHVLLEDKQIILILVPIILERLRYSLFSSLYLDLKLAIFGGNFGKDDMELRLRGMRGM